MDISNQRNHSWVHRLLQSVAQRNFLPKSIEERLTATFKISALELRMILGAILLASLIIALMGGKEEAGPNTTRELEISTLIPSGFVLVPIQLKNFESVDSILGPFGVVDLFTEAKSGQTRWIVRDIKILRAPKNPSLFAVLAPQDRAPLIIQADEIGLFAVIKNNSSRGTEFVEAQTEVKKKQTRITYATEDE